MKLREIPERLGTLYWRSKFLLTRQNVTIGKNCRLSFRAQIIPRKGKIIIGDRCKVMHGAILDTFNGSIILGTNVSLNYFSILYGHGGLTVGSNTRIAAHSVIIPANHIFESKDTPIYLQGETRKGITIGEDVWLATGVVVLDGCTIKNHCVIGANSTVTKDTVEAGVYVGSPAKKVKQRGRT